MRFCILTLVAGLMGSGVMADTRVVYAEDGAGDRIAIATIDLTDSGTYTIAMNDHAFTDHFLSMRPFKCLEGPSKHWCHVPYPYDIKRDISSDLTDLEYDLLFVWKDANEYGINMWNGVYYRLSEENGVLTGELLEMDMDLLSAPPPAGELRPLRVQDLHESDPDSHWLPRVVIE